MQPCSLYYCCKDFGSLFLDSQQANPEPVIACSLGVESKMRVTFLRSEECLRDGLVADAVLVVE